MSKDAEAWSYASGCRGEAFGSVVREGPEGGWSRNRRLCHRPRTGTVCWKPWEDLGDARAGKDGIRALLWEMNGQWWAGETITQKALCSRS